MTNGEKLVKVFPNIEPECRDDVVDVYGLSSFSVTFKQDWWNAEYEGPTTQERQAESDRFDAAFQDGYDHGYAQARFDYEQESNKNDLGVDLIDREKAIEEVWNVELAGLDNKKVVDKLKELPSVIPQPRWTFVSERLPKEQGLYLVTIKSEDKYYIDIDLYNTLYKKGFRIQNVIAWMPLPLAYRADINRSGEEE